MHTCALLINAQILADIMISFKAILPSRGKREKALPFLTENLLNWRFEAKERKVRQTLKGGDLIVEKENRT